MGIAREVRERDGLKLYRNALSRRLLAAEGYAPVLRVAVCEFPDLLAFDLWQHPSGTLMLCRTDNRPAALAKDSAWVVARDDVLFATDGRADAAPRTLPVPSVAQGQWAFL